MAHQNLALSIPEEEHEALSQYSSALDKGEGSRTSHDTDDDFSEHLPDPNLEQELDAADDAETLRQSQLEGYNSDDDDCSTPISLFHAGYSMLSPVRAQGYPHITRVHEPYIAPRDPLADRGSRCPPSAKPKTLSRTATFIKRHTTKPASDPNLVSWDENDPASPHSQHCFNTYLLRYDNDTDCPVDWPAHQRWISTIIIAMYAFIAPMASTMVAPALDTISDEFDLKTNVEEFLVMSIFLLAFAIGPFLWGKLCCSRCVVKGMAY